MPLEVTASPAVDAVGAGPPGQVAAADSQQPANLGAILFASLLAQKAQPVPGKSRSSRNLEPDIALQKPTTLKGKTATAEQDKSQAQMPDPALAIWAALALLQNAPAPIAPSGAASQNAAAPAMPNSQNEVMDTVSRSAPISKSSESASGGLLPQAPAAESASAPELLQASLPAREPVPQFDTAAQPDAAAQPHAAGLAQSLPAGPVQSPLIAAALTPSADVSPPIPAGTALPTVTGDPLPLPVGGALPLSAAASPVDAPASMLPAVASMPTNSLDARSDAPPVAKTAQPPATTPAAESIAAPAVQAADVVGSPAPLPQIGLQNIALPANNTGRAASGGTATAAPVAKGGAAKAAAGVIEKLHSGIEAILPGNQIAHSAKEADWDQPKGDSLAQAQLAPGQSPEAANVAAMAGIAPAVAAGGDQAVNSPLASAKPLDNSQASDMARQIAENVSAIKPQVLAAGQGQMTVQLHPKEWGDLRVTISLAPSQSIDGVKQTTVAAHIVASSPAVKDALDDHASDLNQALRDIGLHLDRLTVAVQATGAASQSGAAASDGQAASGQSNAGQSPAPQPQAWHSGAGFSGGSMASFAAFSQGHGGSAFHSQADTGNRYAGRDSSDQDASPIINRIASSRGGFDRRA